MAIHLTAVLTSTLTPGHLRNLNFDPSLALQNLQTLALLHTMRRCDRNPWMLTQNIAYNPQLWPKLRLQWKLPFWPKRCLLGRYPSLAPKPRCLNQLLKMSKSSLGNSLGFITVCFVVTDPGLGSKLRLLLFESASLEHIQLGSKFW